MSKIQNNPEEIKAKVKDGKILNLTTNRWIKVNGAVYNKLINQRILKVKTDQTIVFYRGTQEKALQLKKDLKGADLPPNTELIARNGMLSTRQRNVKKQEIAEHIQKIAIEVYNDNKDRIDPNLPTDEIQRLLRPLINQRLINEATLPPRKTTVISKSVKYLLENLQSDSDSDSSEYDYFTETDSEEEKLSTVEEEEEIPVAKPPDGAVIKVETKGEDEEDEGDSEEWEDITDVTDEDDEVKTKE